MLTHLSIRNILLIEALDLEFADGLNVLTGETGAGKSILLDSLGFVLGWRGRADLTRVGASHGEVEASFELQKGHGIFDLLDEAGLGHDDGRIVLRRIVNADGRKRAFLNDRAISTELLRDIGDRLIESHGQHDDKGLLNEKTHGKMLDQFGGYDLAPMKEAHRHWQEQKKALADYEQSVTNAAQDADYLQHSVNELQTLDVQSGEAEALDEKRRMMQKGKKLAGDMSEVLNQLGADGIGQAMSDALKRIEVLSSQFDGEMDEALRAVETAYEQMAQAEQQIAHLAEAMEYDPLALEEAEERLFAIRAAERKYQKTSDELPALLALYQKQLHALEDQSQLGETLLQAFKKAQDEAEDAARALSDLRQEAAKALDAEILRELAPLKLEHALFQTELSTGDLSSSGIDQVRFVVKTNPGAPAGALSKIASGGELSRFLLALKLSFQHDKDRTILFDEIDRGVGGQTADAVGRRLRQLATNQQLIIVTHSPQVAAFGERQFQVQKSQSAGETTTQVKELGHEARIHEIARMISGDRVTDEALAAAQKLLEAGKNA